MGSHPQFCNREERKQQDSPRVETIMSLKTARSATASGGYYGSSCVGKFVLCRKENSWKVSIGAQPRELSHGEKAQLGTPAKCLNFPGQLLLAICKPLIR